MEVKAGETVDAEELLLLAGDISGNNIVDLMDLAILARAYAAEEGNPRFDKRADFNADGIIDIDDLAFLRWNYDQEGYGGRIVRQALAGESPDVSLRLPPPPTLKRLPVPLFRSPWASQGELAETVVPPGFEDYSL